MKGILIIFNLIVTFFLGIEILKNFQNYFLETIPESSIIMELKNESLAVVSLKSSVYVDDHINLASIIRAHMSGAFDFIIFKTKGLLFSIATQDHVNIIINNGTGEHFIFDIRADLTPACLDIELDDYLWKSLIDHHISFELAQKISDLLINFLDVHNMKAQGRLKCQYYKQGEEYMITTLSFEDHYGHTSFCQLSNEGFLPSYVDQYDIGLADYMNKSPIKYGILTSEFNNSRKHPITQSIKYHFGTDYATILGDPIYAVKKGKVETIAFKRNNGNYIKLDHGKGLKSQYLHMDSFNPDLKEGDFVNKNDIIGYVGQTGLATAPHVCFRLWNQGQQVNHLKYKDIKRPKKSKKVKLENLDKYLQSFDCTALF